MSAMKASHGHSEACCNIPPIVSKGYQPKGSYEEIGGRKAYVTGPDTADRGLIHIFDIFGYYDQTVQGADILATSDDKHKYKVIMPDWFDGHPADLSWFPPQNDEQKKKLGDFFGKYPPPSVAAKVPEIVKAAAKKFPNVHSWGIIGFCWGGKVVSLVTSNPDTNNVCIAAECHPAMVEPEDAEGIKVPLIMLASKDEDADKVAKFEKALKTTHHVETFKDQIHGWMGARGDLSDSRVKEEYQRGYKLVLEFFYKNWD